MTRLRTNLRALAMAGAAASLVAGLAAPAGAETVRVRDGRDTPAAQELLGVRVSYERMLTIAMRFSSNYFTHGEVPYTLWYDTKPKNPGPEYAFYEHFGSVYKVRGWRGSLRHPVDCFVTGARNTKRHVWRITVSDRCFGKDTGPVRVSVSAMAKPRPGQGTVVDYVPGRHAFSEPVARR